jgi:site-specific DNA-methyltransferase (adenine-specific)
MIVSQSPRIDLIHGDCMDYMATLPDNAFELAIVDPPYGIGEDGGKCRTRGSKKTNGIAKKWDSQKPQRAYFDEVRRVSTNQIIWGGNYFADMLTASRCWIWWRKMMGGDFADGELAWTSFDRVAKEFRMRSETFNRIHPTQKPVALYRWLLHNYAKQGDRILDTHLGSGSSAIACHGMGFDMVGIELDADYYTASVKRFKEQTAQVAMAL